MSLSVPDTVQTALLFDDAMILDLYAFAERFQKEQAARDELFELIEASPEHSFVRLSGASGFAVTVEQMTEPLKRQPLQGVLDSPYLQIVSPKAAEKVEDHRSGTLISISREAGPGGAGLQESQDEFLLRLETLASLTRAYGKLREPALIHWTQSNQLLDYETFVALSKDPQPGPINIHPQLFSDKTDAQGHGSASQHSEQRIFLTAKSPSKARRSPGGNFTNTRWHF